MKKLKLLVSIFSTLALFSCVDNSEIAANGLETITIGIQEWMTVNLNVDKFQNGEPILEAKTKDEWEVAFDNETPAWCYYDFDPSNATEPGLLV